MSLISPTHLISNNDDNRINFLITDIPIKVACRENTIDIASIWCGGAKCKTVKGWSRGGGGRASIGLQDPFQPIRNPGRQRITVSRLGPKTVPFAPIHHSYPQQERTLWADSQKSLKTDVDPSVHYNHGRTASCIVLRTKLLCNPPPILDAKYIHWALQNHTTKQFMQSKNETMSTTKSEEKVKTASTYDVHIQYIGMMYFHFNTDYYKTKAKRFVNPEPRVCCGEMYCHRHGFTKQRSNTAVLKDVHNNFLNIKLNWSPLLLQSIKVLLQ